MTHSRAHKKGPWLPESGPTVDSARLLTSTAGAATLGSALGVWGAAVGGALGLAFGLSVVIGDRRRARNR